METGRGSKGSAAVLYGRTQIALELTRWLRSWQPESYRHYFLDGAAHREFCELVERWLIAGRP